MGLFNKLRRHAAVARGDFQMLSKDLKIPPLPAAVNQLLAEINRSEPNIDRLVKLISADPEITAKVIKTVNSSLYSPRVPVADVKRAVTMLGLAQIRSIVLAFATMEALPQPKGNGFDHNAFWIDSLLRAILARALSQQRFSGQLDEVFTAALLSELAVPLLLCVWAEYYEPVVAEWQTSDRRLSDIEREQFGWDHAQAGAWIVQSWEFPEEMICYIGAHNMSMEKLQEMELQDTIVMPLAVASGLFALWLVGWFYPQAGLSDPFVLNWYRILVIALTMGVSGVMMVGIKCIHPPAAASALIAAMGFLNSPAQVLGVIGAMILLVLEAILFNRFIGGLPYPLWRADPKVARHYGALAGIPDSETTFWRRLAAKTVQKR